jgi:hypothetical protein
LEGGGKIEDIGELVFDDKIEVILTVKKDKLKNFQEDFLEFGLLTDREDKQNYY